MSGINLKNFHDLEVSNFDVVVVGCGFAGGVCARQLAELGNKKVLIIEKRNHIAGNMYDEKDEHGILVHKYGPHIFHTYSKTAADYFQKFSETFPYEHRVKADVYGKFMPVPFNKTSMEIAFGADRANELIHKMIKKFGDEVKVTINELREQKDKDLAEVADYVYENVFLHYTEKQWGLTPDEVDQSITARVPIFISRDDRYFQDPYQFMPREGYTKLFENMLSHKNITVALNVEAQSVFGLEFVGNNEDDKLKAITIQFKEFSGPIIYTGPLDELFLGRFGRLPYRSLYFQFENVKKEYVFPATSINYTVSQDYTRITEFKHMTGQKAPTTTYAKEFSVAYTNPDTQTPYYAIISEENYAHYQRYRNLVTGMPNFYVIGRLAEYKYYNMDQIIEKAILLSQDILDNE